MSRGQITVVAVVVVLGIALWLYESGYFSGDGSDGASDGDASGVDPTDNNSAGVGLMQYTGNLIQTEEGEQLTAYPDAGGYSIGFGHHGSDVTAGETIDDATAQALLQQDIQTAVDFVNNTVQIPLTQDQFNALVDFVYNVGVGTASAGTVFSQLNSGGISGAIATLQQYIHSGGQVVTSLITRRAAEASAFSGETS